MLESATKADTQTKPITVEGLSRIAHQYDGYIVDLWGVVHDGYRLFEDVTPCLQHLKAQGKKVVFLSNAPRSSGVVIDQLNDLGLPLELYEDVITSGDMTIDFLRRHDDKTYCHIGIPEKDSSLIVGIGMNPVARIYEADIIIASNFEDERPRLSDYFDDFDRAIERKIPMVCANPDLLVYRGEEKAYCAGTLAQEYARRGGKVHFFGKPYPATYDFLISRHQARNWLAIGDALATDIRGANQSNIDSLFVKSGIHQAEAVHDFSENQPTYICERLVW